MAMIVEDRLRLGEAVEQFQGLIVPQEKVLGDENVAHGVTSNKKTPPIAAKRSGGAGTEKRPMTLILAN